MMNMRHENEKASFLERGESNRNNNQTRVEYLKKALEDEIVSGRIISGTHLDEQRLADWFNVSRTPVREALRELVAINLVDKRPRRGFIVKQITVPELSDLFESMALMEAACGRLCAERMNQQELSQFKELYDQMNIVVNTNHAEEYADLNSQFHTIIYQCSHNTVLAQTVGNLRRRTAPFRRAQFRMLQRIQASHGEHQAILNSIIAHKPDDVYIQLYEHIIRARDSACEYLDALSHDDPAMKHEHGATMLMV